MLKNKIFYTLLMVCISSQAVDNMGLVDNKIETSIGQVKQYNEALQVGMSDTRNSVKDLQSVVDTLLYYLDQAAEQIGTVILLHEINAYGQYRQDPQKMATIPPLKWNLPDQADIKQIKEIRNKATKKEDFKPVLNLVHSIVSKLRRS